MGAIAIYISVYDFKFHIISDRVNTLLLLLALFGTMFLSFRENNLTRFAFSWLIGLGIFAFLYLLAVISQGAIGGGDVKFAPSLGVLLAWLNPASGAWFLLLAFQLAGLGAIHKVIFLRRSLKQRIAFGPYLSMSYVATAVYLLAL